MWTQNKIASASFSANPLILETTPVRMEVGIVCWSRRKNKNILSLAGMNPNLSFKVTISIPNGDTKNNRAITITLAHCEAKVRKGKSKMYHCPDRKGAQAHNKNKSGRKRVT